MKEFEVAAKPIKRFLAEHYDPMCTAVISMDNIQISEENWASRFRISVAGVKEEGYE